MGLIYLDLHTILIPSPEDFKLSVNTLTPIANRQATPHEKHKGQRNRTHVRKTVTRPQHNKHALAAWPASHMQMCTV